MDFTLVERQEQVDGLVAALPRDQPIAVDTEADSLHHYREKVCLIQITADGRNWIVDTLCDLDFGPLMRTLAAGDLLIHGADYDLRLMHRQYGFHPRSVFDTMLAAQLLGREQIGLAAMASEICGVELDKSGQRADWSIRPIPGDLLTYAVDDTRYLHRIAGTLRDELEKLGRLEWHTESCRRAMEAARQPRIPDEHPHMKVKGAGALEPGPAGVLREIWQWREAIAERADCPPFKIMPAGLMLAWSRWGHHNPDALVMDGPTLPRHIQGRRLDDFIEALQKGRLRPDPRRKRRRSHGKRRPPVDPEKLKQAKAIRDELAGELELQPGVLASQDALREMLTAPIGGAGLTEASPVMRWQAQLLGPRLMPLFVETFSS